MTRRAIPMTYSLAMAISRDYANRQMRESGRSKWNADDYRLAVETFDRLYGSSAVQQMKEDQ